MEAATDGMIGSQSQTVRAMNSPPPIGVLARAIALHPARLAHATEQRLTSPDGKLAVTVPGSFRQPLHTAWQGRARAILRPKDTPGRITLMGEADSLNPAAIIVRTR
jgi:hypothetical protein